MIQEAKRRGRRPVSPEKRHVSAPWSIPQWVIDRITAIAIEQDVAASAVALSFLKQGIAMEDARKQMEAA